VKGPFVREAFGLAATGEYSLRRLLTVMTEKGLLSRNGRPMGISSFWKMLSNPYYLGQVRYNNELILGSHEAMTNRESFDLAQAYIALRCRNRRRLL
jgi:site-specific DNA recombinase